MRASVRIFSVTSGLSKFGLGRSIHPSGRAVMSKYVAPGLWRTFHKLSRDRSGPLTLAGPMAMICIVTTWSGLMVFVGVCVYLSHPGFTLYRPAGPRITAAPDVNSTRLCIRWLRNEIRGFSPWHPVLVSRKSRKNSSLATSAAPLFFESRHQLQGVRVINLLQHLIWQLKSINPPKRMPLPVILEILVACLQCPEIPLVFIHFINVFAHQHAILILHQKIVRRIRLPAQLRQYRCNVHIHVRIRVKQFSQPFQIVSMKRQMSRNEIGLGMF